MSGFWGVFDSWLESQICVDDDWFVYNDVRFLAALPLIPFFAASWFIEAGSTLDHVVTILGLAVFVSWTVYVLRVRKRKKQHWVVPTRYSDDRNGY